jgi:hypothetical protein
MAFPHCAPRSVERRPGTTSPHFSENSPTLASVGGGRSAGEEHVMEHDGDSVEAISDSANSHGIRTRALR